MPSKKPRGRRARATTDVTRLVAETATTLARAPIDDVEAEIERSLKLLARAIGADDLALCAGGNDGPITLRAQHRTRIGWMDPVVGMNLDFERATRLAAVVDGEELVCDDLDQLPRASHYERDYFAARGATGVAAVPLRSESIRGILIADTGARDHTWQPETLSLLEAFGDAAAAALERALHQRDLCSRLDAAVASRDRARQLLALLAHEMRAPLTAIIGYAEMLHAGLVGSLDGDQTRHVADILDGANHLGAIIEDTVSLIGLDTGMLSLRVGALDPVDVMETALRHVRPRAERGRIELVAHLPRRGDVVYGDRQRLVQVFTNLLVNAVKFTPEGGRVTARLRLDTETYTGEVEDTGIGIGERDREVVFDKFARLGGDHEGLGLGLPLVAELVRLHGGDVTLDSAQGHGSQFRVELPRRPPSRMNERRAFLPGAEH